LSFVELLVLVDVTRTGARAVVELLHDGKKPSAHFAGSEPGHSQRYSPSGVAEQSLRSQRNNSPD